ncbi:MAG: response regulator [Candidatus Hodarchaeales archaeon]|jgi:two-component system chemotaxis response regulator CheY
MVVILLADDSKYVRDLLKIILIKEGHDIIEASSGQETLEMYSNNKPDLVLLDILMDEPNGIECVKLIKGTNPEAKILMVSAFGQENIVKEAIDVGAMDYLVKPFKKIQIVEAINKVLREQN